ncbi:unnamed protein product [Adineta steineri]|uniref:GDP-fucose protein O-fucosyltransferase 1 n=2 Tax=Adineta steineri TaxID=433720 RepID=A0A819PB88_9BILA|nr:unnamed protein product [Adineta steineri]CAF4011521.1 unnamed protein product [Adineta steineri]
MIAKLLLLLLYFNIYCFAQYDVDPNGYIMFCPCMGRFGNQAEQFLGVISFARTLNRTLVLPHWIEYPTRSITSDQIPFDRYFQVEPLQTYLKVILMKDFMKHLADKVWPKGKRYVFCYSAQINEESPKQSCHAKDGNPFGPFWSHFNIDFDQDIFYQPLFYEVLTSNDWNTKYPSTEYPVLAFSGPPGTLERNIPLVKYFVYSDYIQEKAETFLNKHQISLDTLLAIHLRTGIDFERACTYLNGKSNFFASAQCLGFNLEKGIQLTNDICYPSEEKILKQTENKVQASKSTVLYIAADGDHMMEKFRKRFGKKYGVKIIKYERPSSQSEGEAAHIDLYILSVAKHAIVNCPSTFSAFAKRQRDVRDKLTDFWGIENSQLTNEPNSDL